MAEVKKINGYDIIDHRITGIDTTVTTGSSNVVTSGAVASHVAGSLQDLDLDTVTATQGKIINTISQTDGQVAATTRDMVEADIPSLHLTKISDVSAAASEINILDGATINTAELNTLSDINTETTIQDQLDDKEEADATILKKAQVVDNVTTITNDVPLSANQGKLLNDRINNLESLGRYLALWNCITGLPTTNPTTMPYTYRTGDYYRISAVGTTNYRPSGDTYNGIASTTIESDVATIGYVYFYDGTNWSLQVNHIGGLVTDVTAGGTSTLSGSTAVLAKVAASGSYGDLGDLPDIPSKTSDLTNDSGFITKDVANLTNYMKSSDITTALGDKVDKVTGKGLSTNDFTDAYKSNVDSNTSAKHTHSNKSTLDGIASSDITNWNNKQDALPTVIKDKYLHTNSSTGALEWSTVTQGTTSFNDLTNRPSYNGTTMTSATAIPEVKTSDWDAKYTKPSTGIPSSDLAESYYLASNPNGYTDDTVANSKYTKPSSGIPDSDIASANTWNSKTSINDSSASSTTETWSANNISTSLNERITNPTTKSANQYLQYNGTTWVAANVDTLPSQEGQSGKYLTTNGTNAFWSTITSASSIALDLPLVSGTLSYNLTHNLGTRMLMVQLYDAVTYQTIVADVTRTTLNSITIEFGTLPAHDCVVLCNAINAGTWESPVQTGDVLSITQLYGLTQTNNILEVV